MNEDMVEDLLARIFRAETKVYRERYAFKLMSCVSPVRAYECVLDPRRSTEEEERHIHGCRRCGRLVAACRQEAVHPSLWHLARFRLGRLGEADDEAARRHLDEDECRRCAKLRLSDLMKKLVGRARRDDPVAKDLAERTVVGEGSVPALVGAFASSPTNFEIDAGEPDGAFMVTLAEIDGALEAEARTRDLSQAGKKVTIEVLGEEVNLAAHVVLEAGGDMATATHRFGSFKDLAPRFGRQVVILVAPDDL